MRSCFLFTAQRFNVTQVWIQAPAYQIYHELEVAGQVRNIVRANKVLETDLSSSALRYTVSSSEKRGRWCHLSILICIWARQNLDQICSDCAPDFWRLLFSSETHCFFPLSAISTPECKTHWCSCPPEYNSAMRPRNAPSSTNLINFLKWLVGFHRAVRSLFAAMKFGNQQHSGLAYQEVDMMPDKLFRQWIAAVRYVRPCVVFFNTKTEQKVTCLSSSAHTSVIICLVTWSTQAQAVARNCQVLLSTNMVLLFQCRSSGVQYIIS